MYELDTRNCTTVALSPVLRGLLSTCPGVRGKQAAGPVWPAPAPAGHRCNQNSRHQAR